MYCDPLPNKRPFLIEYRFYYNLSTDKADWLFFKVVYCESIRPILEKFYGPQYRIKRIHWMDQDEVDEFIKVEKLSTEEM